MKHQKFHRSSASVVIDASLNVVSISQSIYDIYGFNKLPLPITLDKVIKARDAAGWFTLSEAFSNENTINSIIHRMKYNNYYRDFDISNSGEIIDVTHYKDSASGFIFFNCVPTYAFVSRRSEESVEIRGLMALRDLIQLGMIGAFPITFEQTQPKGQVSVPFICGPKSGRVFILDEAQAFPELNPIQYLEDLSLKMHDVTCALDQVGQYSARVELEGREPLQLDLKRQIFYKGGPNFLAGKLVRLWGDITAESIRNEFPNFSLKEAEVICLLVRGNTLKEAAAKMGKAPVTATLQARSAQLKSGERSVNALVARITHSLLY